MTTIAAFAALPAAKLQGNLVMNDRINRQALRQGMISALDQIARNANVFADTLRQQQAGEDSGTPFAITTYFGEMEEYVSKYSALCHAAVREKETF